MIKEKGFSPLYLVEEISARCFANCPGCFRGFVKGPFDGDMTLETFENANKGVPRGTMILPAFHGESLLHPDFDIIIQRYRELGLRVSIPTSGFAGERHIPLLVGEGTPVYILIVSIDGFQPRTHQVRRGRISLEKAEGFVDACLAKRGTRRYPQIAVRWVEGEQSEIEFDNYLRRWLFEKKVDFVLRSRMFNYGTQFNSEPMGICHSLIEGNPVVLFNGDVLLCERVADREKYVIGNVNRDDWPTIISRRDPMVRPYPQREPCKFCSAAYLLSGSMGTEYLRHPRFQNEAVPIYTHSDHSQKYYSLVRDWKGINWSMKEEA